MENLEMIQALEFWKNKKVFITGHTGFKGSWLALWLESLGAQVTGYALPPATNPSLFEIAEVAKNIHSVEGDIRDLKSLLQALEKSESEIVLHLAAQALVLPSYENPLDTHTTNIIGTANVLEALRKCDFVKSAVIVTTDKCYENREWIWPYREGEALGGSDPYSASKACAEIITASYRHSFFTKQGASIASARAGNVVGGGDWSGYRLVPDILNSLLSDQPIKLRNPMAVRPWQHVLEPLHGYLMLAQALYHQTDHHQNHLTFSEAWNFGPEAHDSHRSVQWVTERLAQHWGNITGQNKELLIQKITAPVFESSLLHLDSSKAHMKLGWIPRWGLDTTLEKIVEWHLAFKAQQDMRAFSLGQIASFSKDPDENRS